MLTYVFVHGLAGWGSYDEAYRRRPYWGMGGGDLIAFLRGRGYGCYAASVSPMGSAWDRACELYAQLAGARVDYGEAHSKACRHPRYGRDFSGCPLIPAWGPDTRLVLIGHSFGGATVRMLTELLAHGDPDERGTDSPSPLFLGGMAERVHAVIALASPLNGTTAYDLAADPGFDANAVPAPWWSGILSRLMSMGLRSETDGRDPLDCAAADMHVDRALRLNARLQTLPDVYWFSVPCSATVRQPDGTHRPVLKKMEPLYTRRGCQIGCWTGKTAGGAGIGEAWLENDGLVNTLSARAPFGAPQRPLDEDRIERGVWQVLPAFDGDHMSLQGGLMRKRDVKDFYLRLLALVPGDAG